MMRFCTGAIALLVSIGSWALEPPIVVTTGQEIIAKGRINVENAVGMVNGRVGDRKAIYFRPQDFYSSTPNANSAMRFELIPAQGKEGLLEYAQQIDGSNVEVQCTIRLKDQSLPGAPDVCEATGVRTLNPEPSRPATANVDLSNRMFTTLPHEFVMQKQLEVCSDFAAAGNKHAGDLCEQETRGAYAYLAGLAKTKPLPSIFWSLCSTAPLYPDSYPLQARCMAAVQDICKLTPAGEPVDFHQCYRIMQDGTWVANPKARSLRF